jgi:hypothetical protein
MSPRISIFPYCKPIKIIFLPEKQLFQRRLSLQCPW